MDSGCNATQLIDGDGNFKDDCLENFMKTTGLDQCGLNYAIVAIMGPQSSGKSTLLNKLFGTNFVEMNAFRGRKQTTKGIWMAKCVGVQPPTIVMDVEGTDGKERGEVMVQMSKPRRTTILFVIRDKSKTPEDILGIQLREELQEIWDAVPKPEAHVNTPLSEFFTVEVIALSSYEHMEEKFHQEVDQLRQRFINSTAAQGGMAGDRRDVVPASGLPFSAENLWKDIKQNKDLDIPAHKLLVAAFRCEKIANETLEEFSANQELLALQKKMQEGYVPGAGKTLLSILEHYLEKKYDIEASLFDDDEKNGKRQILKTKALQFVSPALRKMLENLSSKLLDNFKTTLEHSLAKGKGFEASAGSCSESCMTEFLKGCEEAEVGQTDWDATNMKEKLQHDIDAHKSSLRRAKLSELLTNYENKLSEAIRGALGTLFRACTDDTWASIRTLIEKETKVTTSEFLTAAAGFELQENECKEKLRDHAKNMVKKEARIVANDVSASMLGRFTSIFTWNGKEDIQVLSKKAQLASLKLLSIMAAIRLVDKPDNIEKLLVSSLHEKTTGPLTSKTWEKVCPEDTIIGPAQCHNLWYQFDENIKPMINKVEHMETRINALSDESKERHELLKELQENDKKNQKEREENIFEIKIRNPLFWFR